jgi:hypothetical protein
VYGLDSASEEGDMAGRIVLGSFAYDGLGPAVQTFHMATAQRAFPLVQLAVADNHGHPDFTCLYRFRVHGGPAGTVLAVGDASAPGVPCAPAAPAVAAGTSL